MTPITLPMTDPQVEELRSAYDHFVRVSSTLDPDFSPPEFSDFLRARLLNNAELLTEKAVDELLSGGRYAWAKRTAKERFPELFSALMRQARKFGFGFAARSNWTPENRLYYATQWATHITEEAGLHESLISPMAEEIANAATDIQLLEHDMQTPSIRLVDYLREQIREVDREIERAKGPMPHARLVEIRTLYPMAVQAGLVSQPEADARLFSLYLSTTSEREQTRLNFAFRTIVPLGALSAFVATAGAIGMALSLSWGDLVTGIGLGFGSATIGMGLSVLSDRGKAVTMIVKEK